MSVLMGGRRKPCMHPTESQSRKEHRISHSYWITLRLCICLNTVSTLAMSNHTPHRQSSSAGTASSSSRYSTPLQHHAVSRLRGNNSSRQSHTPPSSHQSSSSVDQYSTPRSSRTSYSSQSPATGAGQETAASPRTPIQGTPSRRKGAVRIVKAHKPWHERWNTAHCITSTRDLSAECSVTDLQSSLSNYGIDMNYNWTNSYWLIWRSSRISLIREHSVTSHMCTFMLFWLTCPYYTHSAAFATLALHFFLRVIVGASTAFSSSSKSRSDNITGRHSSKASRYANSAEARLEELRLSTQGRIASWGGFKTLIYRSVSLRLWLCLSYLFIRTDKLFLVLPKTTLLCWILVFASLANAFWLFSNRRKYRLFMQDVRFSSCPRVHS